MWPCYRTGKLLKHPLVAEASVRLGSVVFTFQSTIIGQSTYTHTSYYIQINMKARRSFDFWASASQPQIMLDPLGPWVVLDDYLNRCSNCANLRLYSARFVIIKQSNFRYVNSQQ